MSENQRSVQEFMRRKGLTLPEKPGYVPAELRMCCARLLLEETLETIQKGLGIGIKLDAYPIPLSMGNLTLDFNGGGFDLVETVDGTADVRYVSYYIDSICGVNSEPIDAEVCANNLAKFGEGSYMDENGKWCKPPNHPQPRIRELLIDQGWTP